MGCGKVMKRGMYGKMGSGKRKMYGDYVELKRWKGKIVGWMEGRRKMEYVVLFSG